MAPAHVVQDHTAKLRQIYAAQIDRNQMDRHGRKVPKRLQYPKFRVGDTVRLSDVRGIFAKGYEGKWTEEIMFIDKVYPKTLPHMYRVRDVTGQTIKGRFYAHELQAVHKPIYYQIEKFVTKRKTRTGSLEYYVKWKGYPSSANSWIPEASVKDIVGSKVI